VREVNLPSQIEVMPSQTLIKTWELTNSGAAAWPEGTKLVYKRGDLPSLENEFVVQSAVAPGQTVAVSAVVRTPAVSGRVRAAFRLSDKEGIHFGPRLWCDLVVKADVPVPAPLPTPVPVPVASAPVQEAEKYPVQMEALKSMGWDNRELNTYLLEQNNGNVQKVCNWLLEQMKD
jgi:next-to-BRCA1 protein 1